MELTSKDSASLFTFRSSEPAEFIIISFVFAMNLIVEDEEITSPLSFPSHIVGDQKVSSESSFHPELTCGASCDLRDGQ